MESLSEIQHLKDISKKKSGNKEGREGGNMWIQKDTFNTGNDNARKTVTFHTLYWSLSKDDRTLQINYSSFFFKKKTEVISAFLSVAYI